MIKYSIYIITYDKSNWVLSITLPLLNKYWNISKNVKILGYKKPEIDLSDKHEFISMRPKQESIDDWCLDIYSIMKNDNNEYVVLMLDDFLPSKFLDKNIFNFFGDLMQNDGSILRCALGTDLHFLPHLNMMKYDDFDLIELAANASYGVTTQISLWRKDMLLDLLLKSKSPWDFELSNYISNLRILGTYRKYAFEWNGESALSGVNPNKFNILGLDFEDIKWMLDNNLVTKEMLQYGCCRSDAPQFSEIGYNFKIEMLKPYTDIVRYNRFVEKYGQFYI